MKRRSRITAIAEELIQGTDEKFEVSMYVSTRSDE